MLSDRQYNLYKNSDYYVSSKVSKKAFLKGYANFRESQKQANYLNKVARREAVIARRNQIEKNYKINRVRYFANRSVNFAPYVLKIVLCIMLISLLLNVSIYGSSADIPSFSGLLNYLGDMPYKAVIIPELPSFDHTLNFTEIFNILLYPLNIFTWIFRTVSNAFGTLIYFISYFL